LSGIEESKKKPFDRLLFGLGIRHIGATIAKKLTEHFKDIDSLIAATQEDITAVHEIGDRIAESLVKYFNNEQHIQQINLLKEYGLNFKVEDTAKIASTNKLSGNTFLISGVFEDISRNELKELIEDNGGKMISGISKNLDYLVAGENMGPSKLAKAQKLNIKIISQEELFKMIN